ncbi:hypothetical protein D2E27_06610 [Mycobacteroides abscessus]|nr:hypothetical protein D2E27_06610 [Mycobacteroides abscessus]RIS07879.1 hypothetical protein D2E58_03960 [Mycobacteroides abscessus]
MANRRTRRAEILPPGKFDVPINAINESDISFTASNENGTKHAAISLGRLPGSDRLKLDLITAMARLNGPRGGWRSIDTVLGARDSVSAFLRWLDDVGEQPESVAAVDGALWMRWILHNGGASTTAGASRLRTTRQILLAVPDLQESLNAALARRTGKSASIPQESYSREEFRQIRRAARKIVHQAARRIASNNEILYRYRSGHSSEQDGGVGWALDELADNGMAISVDVCKQLSAWRRGQPLRRDAQAQLFLTPHEAWACTVLLTAETGWNPSVTQEMAVPDTTAGAGEDVDVFTMRIDKPRRGPHRHSTNTFIVAPTSEAGRAIKWVRDATDPARDVLASIGQPTDRLIVYGRYKGYTADNRFVLGFPDSSTTRTRSSWAPINPISLQRLRRTRQVLFDRTPTQNTRATHDDVYVLNDASTRDGVRPVIEKGLNSALLAAEEYVRLRIVAEQSVDERVRSGKGDTAIAACTDYHHHPDTQETCTDSFLDCLSCANSIATPRHLGRLMVLHAALDELRSTLTNDEWSARWDVHYWRLSLVLERNTTAAERGLALSNAPDSDRALVNRLLGGEFSA